MTAITVSSKYQIVIPKEAREILHIKPGARLHVVADSTGLRLTKEATLEEVRALLSDMQWQEQDVRDETDRQVP